MATYPAGILGIVLGKELSESARVLAEIAMPHIADSKPKPFLTSQSPGCFPTIFNSISPSSGESTTAPRTGVADLVCLYDFEHPEGAT